METLTAPIASSEAASPAHEHAPQEFADQQTSGAESSQTATQNGERPLSAGQKQQDQEQQPKKELSRYERTKRQRAEFQKREAALKQREEQLARIERERTEPKKPEYTLAELKKWRQAWVKEAEWDAEKADLVEKADVEIKRLEELEKQEHGQQSFQDEWHQAEADLAASDPEFGAGKGTRLDKQLQQILGGPDGQIYRQHPRGIVAVYHRARMELLESDHKDALGKIQQLESELKRLTGLTSIGGSAPGRVSSGRVESLSDFSRLSSADMLKHLQAGARKGGGTGWL